MLDTSPAAYASTLPPPPAPKQCGCGLSHDAAAWRALPFVGFMLDEAETIELRNCACGSTLAIEVRP